MFPLKSSVGTCIMLISELHNFMIIIAVERVKAWVALEQMGLQLGRLAPKGSTVHFVRCAYT